MGEFNALDKRLTKAAEEVRQAMRTLSPPPSPGTKPRALPAARGWLVFAGAFAVVALAIGVLPLLDGRQGSPVASPPSSTLPVEPPSTEPESTVPGTDSPVAECSATGVPAPAEQPGLPEPVAQKRQAIIEAAMACDFDALEALADEFFSTSFGGGDETLLREWEQRGEGKLDILLEILGMSYATQSYDNGETWYWWPSAFAADTWEDVTQEQRQELLRIHTQEELDMFAEFGSYAGWRTGITADGRWRFFIAGD